MNLKKLSLLAAVMLLFTITARSQNIDPLFVGQNLWLVDHQGSQVYSTNGANVMHHLNEVRASGVKVMRIGGINADVDSLYLADYDRMYDSITAQGQMTVIIQVAVNDGVRTPHEAANVVRHMTNGNRYVKYWCIGNEPDGQYIVNDTTPLIASYIKLFSDSMKSADNTIKIISPSFESFNNFYSSYNLNRLIGGVDDITGISPVTGKPYIDMVDFHSYPFKDQNSNQVTWLSPTTLAQRRHLIEYPRYTGKFSTYLDSLNARMNYCDSLHSRTGGDTLQMCLTEFHVCTDNYTSAPGYGLNGLDGTSFLGGQFNADMMSVGMEKGVKFMCMWSVIEGSNNQSNGGYLDRTTQQPLPSYYHFQLISKLKGTYCKGWDNNLDSLKEFGAKDAAGSRIRVMLMNQDKGSAYKLYTLHLSSSETSAVSGYPVAMNVNAGVSGINYTDTLFSESSMVLTFDLSGQIIEKCVYRITQPNTINCINPCPLAIATNSSTLTCPSSSNGSAWVTASSGTPPYTYLWSNASTNDTITGVASGTYTVSVTDNNGAGCTRTAVVQVSAYDFPNGVSITSDTTWATNLRIKGPVFISNQAKLTINNNAVIEFEDDTATRVHVTIGARLYVHGGAKLTSMQGCGSGKMWWGVQVWGQSTYRQSLSYQGSFVMNGCTIENMRQGIWNRGITLPFINLWLDPNWTSAGGIITATNTTFRNNRIAVQLFPYVNKSAQGQPVPNTMYNFTGCTFTTDTLLNDTSLVPDAHIKMNGVRGVWLIANTFQNTDPALFAVNERGTGIWSVNSTFHVVRECTSNTIPCTNFAKSYFNNLQYGVYVANTSPLWTTNIDNAEFYQVNRGVALRGADYAIVTNNKFDVPGYETANSTTYLPYGLYMEDCTGYSVEENKFTATISTPADSTSGTVIVNSGDLFNITYNNIYDNLYVGTLVMGDNRGAAPADGLFIKCNDFGLSSACIFDIALTTSGEIRQEQGTNSDIKTEAGNRFSHNCTMSDNDYSVLLSQNIDYTHHSDTITTPLCYTNVITNHSTNFIFNKSSACPSSFSTSSSYSNITSKLTDTQNMIDSLNIELIAGNDQGLKDAIDHYNDPQIDSILAAVSPYISDSVLLYLLDKSPALNEVILRDILIDNSPLTEDVMTVLNSMRITDSIMRQIASAQTGISPRELRERDVRYYEAERSLTMDSKIRLLLSDTTMSDGYDSVIAIFNSGDVAEWKHKLVAAYVQTGQYQDALDEMANHSHASGYNYCALQQLIIALDSNEAGPYYMHSSSQLEDDVQDIADAPGKGYVNAHAMLELVFGQKFPENIVLPHPSSSHRKGIPEISDAAATHSSGSLRNYPNPFSEGTVIEATVPADAANAELLVYDVMGKMIKKAALQNGINTISIAGEDLEGGIYFYSLIVNGERLATNKMVYLTR